MLIKLGCVIFVDGGTTTSHLGSCLRGGHLRIITNSLRLAAILEDSFAVKSGPEVFMTGGFLHLKSGFLLGPKAEASIAQYHADIAFLSAGGVDENGIYNNNELVTELEKVMMKNALKTVVLADCSKIGRRSMCHVCNLGNIDILITNKLPENSDILSKIRSSGVEVIEI